jgi:hypothetical protein
MADEGQTQPMLETLIRELREFRVAIEDRLKQADTEVRVVHAEVIALREEITERFDDLDERMEVLAGDVIKVRARSKRPAIEADVHTSEKKRA